MYKNTLTMMEFFNDNMTLTIRTKYYLQYFLVRPLLDKSFKN